MDLTKLKKGSLNLIKKGIHLSQPILAIKDLMKSTRNENEWQSNLSDQVDTMPCLFDSSFGLKIMNGELANNQLIKLMDYSIQNFNNTSYIIPNKVECLSDGKKTKHHNEQQQQQQQQEQQHNLITKFQLNEKMRSKIQKEMNKEKPTFFDIGKQIENHVVTKQNLTEKLDLTPIRELCEWSRNWKVYVRVVHKTNIIRYKNGKGSLMKLLLMDKDRAEIKFVLFQNELEKFGNLLEIGNTYIISGATIKEPNRRYSQKLGERYEMCSNSSTIIQCYEGELLPKYNLSLVKLQEIKNGKVQNFVDVVGVVTTFEPLATIKNSQGLAFQKINFTLVDQSKCTILATFWGNQAIAIASKIKTDSIVALKNVRVKEWRSVKTINSTYETVPYLDPDFKEAQDLRQWWETIGKHQSTSIISDTPTLNQKPKFDDQYLRSAKKLSLIEIRNRNIGSEKTETFVVGAIMRFPNPSQKIWYQACPSSNCNKKVINIKNKYFCTKCNRNYQKFQYRYLFNVTLKDPSDQISVTVFDKIAERMLKKTASELVELDQIQNSQYTDTVRSKLEDDWGYFAIRATTVVYKTKKQNKFILEGYLMENNHISFSHQLINDIKKLMKN
ncbi:replication protein a 70 kda DNA-binding subunit a [Anaeramoeba flamelloides]|uniref:Replication protein a 70 kDa DNA-binding subunit a n=1 Tax=Anaeramoeba flamelloides TaxID=1746091 RepID=A0ABQ8YDV5_9EUKA|nr:replication protein a 70 kda DNA-binding subunit a [Anaeramoeba flamelloides]